MLKVSENKVHTEISRVCRCFKNWILMMSAYIR